MQAYALYQTLSAAGHDVTFFDHRPPEVVKYYRSKLKGHFAGKEWFRYYQFHRFIKKEFPLTPFPSGSLRNVNSALSQVDALIAGSDQIWTTDSASFRGYDPAFFLNFKIPRHVRRISYAASAGSSTTFDPHQTEIGRAINQFHAISVRDENTRQLVLSVSGRKPEMVLDPVFLHSFSEISSRRKLQPSPYIVVYANFLTPKEREFIHRTSARLQLPIVNLGPESNLPNQQQYHHLSPREWLATIRGAQYIFTSFYHGVLFSLKYNIPFLAFPRKAKSIKIDDVLVRYDLKNHLWEPSNPSQWQEILEGKQLKLAKERIEKDAAFSKSFLLEKLTQTTH